MSTVVSPQSGPNQLQSDDWTAYAIDYFYLISLQVSYMILQMVDPVTHAVGNCVKRVVVIVSSVIFFQTPVSPINSIGKFFFLGSRREVL